jgi:hypothetical protein
MLNTTEYWSHSSEFTQIKKCKIKKKTEKLSWPVLSQAADQS